MIKKVCFIVIFAVICLLAVSYLSNICSRDRNKIMIQAYAGEQVVLKEVFAQAASFEPVKTTGKVIYYKALDSYGRFLGVVFKTSARGYSGEIETLTGMYKDGTIIAIKILKQNETLGLGSRISEQSFIRQFSNKKDLSGVQAVTGATTSSRAVIDSVQARAREIMVLIKGEI